MVEGLKNRPHTIEEQENIYELYLTKLGVSDEYLDTINSVCDVGSGANDFVATLKRRHPHLFAIGIDQKEGAYVLSDGHSINHLASDVGIPDYVDKFDLTVAHESIPKYQKWGALRQDIGKKFHDIYDYSLIDTIQEGDIESASDEALASLAEMLRLTKFGGKVIIYSVVLAQDSILSYEELMRRGEGQFDDYVLGVLKDSFPDNEYTLVVDREPTERAKNAVVCRLEIIKRQ